MYLNLLQLSKDEELAAAAAGSVAFRVLSWFSLVASYILFAYYSSDLTAQMTTGGRPVPLR